MAQIEDKTSPEYQSLLREIEELREERDEKLKKIEEQQNILRDAIKNGESLSEVAKKHNINLVKLGD